MRERKRKKKEREKEEKEKKRKGYTGEQYERSIENLAED